MKLLKPRSIVILTIFAMLFVIAGAAVVIATPPDAGCNQTPYENPSGNGANHSGAYDDTCDGSASQNGNGDGKATGKPCAGCVGKADEKNPPGQAPDGSDDNKGYECDENSGVGKSNPAHTGCTPSENPPGEEENPPNGNPGGNPPEVLGEKITRPLAETGVETTSLAVSGALLLLLGIGMRVHQKRTA
jgi:hypothetical protein